MKDAGKIHDAGKGAPTAPKHSRSERIRLASIGLEAEFVVLVDDEPVDPAEVFGDPAGFVRRPLMHRVGSSYHIPTGGAIYFDTGVVEVVTPVIEIEPECAARAGRSLWEGILFLREELDAWERRTGRRVRLRGFSAHYSVSFDLPPGEIRSGRRVEELSLLLTHLLPPPIMLISGNPRSTGVGVRPRRHRVEVTTDFTPSASLTIATATVLTGIIREVMGWPDYSLERLEREGLPEVVGFRPMRHTSREGWLARFTCYPGNPYGIPVDDGVWPCTDGTVRSLREISRVIVDRFAGPIRRVSDAFTWRLIRSLVEGRLPTLLELPDRPPEYDDVGRLCTWDDLFPEEVLSRSRYERVLMRAIRGDALRIAGERHVPVGMRGWSRVVFRRDDGSLRLLSIDYLLDHLWKWEGRRGRPRRGTSRPRTAGKRRGKGRTEA